MVGTTAQLVTFAFDEGKDLVDVEGALVDDHGPARCESWDRQVMQACNVKQRCGQEIPQVAWSAIAGFSGVVNAAARRSL